MSPSRVAANNSIGADCTELVGVVAKVTSSRSIGSLCCLVHSLEHSQNTCLLGHEISAWIIRVVGFWALPLWLPNGLHGILNNHPIHCQNRDIFDLSLRDEDAIKRIFMMVGQGVDLENMG
jgi:hypothetical protein